MGFKVKKILITVGLVLFVLLVALSALGYRELKARTLRGALIVGELPLEESLEEEVRNSLSRAGFRDVKTEPTGFDSHFEQDFMRFEIEVSYLQELKKEDNLFDYRAFYLTVEPTSDLNRCSREEIDSYFELFRGDKGGKVEFTPPGELTINRRVLIDRKDGSPLVFYRAYRYSIKDGEGKPLPEKEKLVALDNSWPELLTVTAFTGDLSIEEFVKWYIYEKGIEVPLAQVNRLLERPDLMGINLEFTVSHRGQREPKRFTFRASESEFQVITNSAIDYAATANNHAMDYGETSLLDTIDYLNKYEILHSGTGSNIDEAFEPAYAELGENRLALFSICEAPRESGGYDVMGRFKATGSKPGVAFFDEARLKEHFRREREEGRLIIVQIHTGQEYALMPIRKHRQFSEALIDLGADVVIGHHPHVVNGVEIYKDKLIAYSLGDFLFDIQKPYADEGIILYLYLYKNRVASWGYHPVVSHHGAVVLEEERLVKVEKLFRELTGRLFAGE